MKTCRVRRKNQGRERKEKKKEIADEANPEHLFLYVPHLYGEDTKINLKMPGNGIFGCQNQLRALSKDDGVIDTCSTIFF